MIYDLDSPHMMRLWEAARLAPIVLFLSLAVLLDSSALQHYIQHDSG
jgi:hypothetical protein